MDATPVVIGRKGKEAAGGAQGTSGQTLTPSSISPSPTFIWGAILPKFGESWGTSDTDLTLWARIKRKYTLSNLSSIFNLGQIIFNVILVFIALGLGLYVLWAGDLDWGSESDFLIAFLWGVGLHGMASQAGGYKGLDDLAGKIK